MLMMIVIWYLFFEDWTQSEEHSEIKLPLYMVLREEKINCIFGLMQTENVQQKQGTLG
jgi:hypothetical protein